jgi:fumarate reductase subunit C
MFKSLLQLTVTVQRLGSTIPFSRHPTTRTPLTSLFAMLQTKNLDGSAVARCLTRVWNRPAHTYLTIPDRPVVTVLHNTLLPYEYDLLHVCTVYGYEPRAIQTGMNDEAIHYAAVIMVIIRLRAPCCRWSCNYRQDGRNFTREHSFKAERGHLAWVYLCQYGRR